MGAVTDAKNFESVAENASVNDYPKIAFVLAFRRLDLRRPVPDFKIEFRPFTTLRSTIRLRDSQVRVRISDLLHSAPPLVLEALAEILLAQLFRQSPSREARECYFAYVFEPAMRRRIDEVRRKRGRKQLLSPRGTHFNLEEIFRKLNQEFFDDQLPEPRLGWSPKQAKTVLGHYDSAHSTIMISQLLDSAKIPRYVIEYLVFHEMLHMRFPVSHNGYRRIIHPPEFRAAERQFPKYRQARHQLNLIWKD